MNSVTDAIANSGQLDYLERLILKKYPQWKRLTFEHYNNDDFMDEHIDKLSKFESKLESLRTNIENGPIYSHKELDISRIEMLLKLIEFSYEFA